MTGCSREDALADAFEQHRAHLVVTACRMLGSRADSEDAVQEAWLRLAREDASAIDNLAGWLTRVVARICIDMLRARRVRPETPYGETLPEPAISEHAAREPEDDILLAESIGSALVVVLGSLSPAERLAFVLHDTFAVPFHGIGKFIGRSTDASKMLASRARRKVRRTPPPSDPGREQRDAVDAFLAAARNGDLQDLLQVLDPGLSAT